MHAHTGGTSCFYQHLLGLHSTKESYAVHSRSLTEWDPKGAIASTDRDTRGDNEKN